VPTFTRCDLVAARLGVQKPTMKCPYCGTNPQPLHDELPIPICCEDAQNEAIYCRPYSEDIEIPAKDQLSLTVVSAILFVLVLVAITLGLAHSS
jgi:hypothetical protein